MSCDCVSCCIFAISTVLFVSFSYVQFSIRLNIFDRAACYGTAGASAAKSKQRRRVVQCAMLVAMPRGDASEIRPRAAGGLTQLLREEPAVQRADLAPSGNGQRSKHRPSSKMLTVSGSPIQTPETAFFFGQQHRPIVVGDFTCSLAV